MFERSRGHQFENRYTRNMETRSLQKRLQRIGERVGGYLPEERERDKV